MELPRSAILHNILYISSYLYFAINLTCLVLHQALNTEVMYLLQKVGQTVIKREV